MRRSCLFVTLLFLMSATSLLADGFQLPIEKSAWQLPRWATNVSVVNEGKDGGPCLKVYTPKRDYSMQIRLPVFYDADVARVVFTGRMKTKNVTGGAAAIEKCRAQLLFLNNDGDRLGNWPQTTDRGGSTDWADFSQDHQCPPGTRVVEVWLGMYLSTGTAWFENLNVTAYDAAGKELTPIKRALEEKTDTAGWWPFTPGEEDTTRPLVIDFKPFMPAPAGKFGFVTEKDGHFAFTDGGRARFWGIGYVKNWHPPKDQAPAVAEALARAGINLVRFHGMDAQDPKASIFDATSDKTDRLDPEKLDQLDFFIAELKKRGVYSDLNLLTKRRYTAADGVREFDKLPQGGKAASMFDRRIIELQKDYARLLLTHVNPYTNLAYKDEPAVAMIEIVNETSINLLEFLGGTPAVYENELDTLFTDWCTKENQPRPEGHIKLLMKRREGTAERFVEHLSRQYFDEMYGYLKNELKVPQPISGTQFDGLVGEKRAQSDLDYYDHHGYWDHPAGGWDPMSIFRNKPMVKLESPTLIEGLVSTRVAHKPFTVSEWNCAWPNDYITEGPLMMVAYLGFNDWDAPMVFGTEGLKWSPTMVETFGHADKPQFMAPMLAGAYAFYRGDVQPGPAYSVDLRKAKANLKIGDLFTREQLLTKRCELVLSGPKGVDADPKAGSDPASTQPATYASADGQITWSPGEFVLKTPRTQAVVGFTGGKPVDLTDGSIAIDNEFGQVIVTSLTDTPIRGSDRLLITATARAENTGQTYRAFRKGLASLGGAPILVEPVKATLTLKHEGSGKPTVYALDAYGRRTEKTLPIEQNASGQWKVTLGQVPALWFEVTFEAGR